MESKMEVSVVVGVIVILDGADNELYNRANQGLCDEVSVSNPA